MKQSCLITLGSESARIVWENGTYSCTGYNLQDEKIALSLTGGLGEGIGTLLVWLWEYGPLDLSLKKLLNSLVLETVLPGARYSLAGIYLSHSPDKERRSKAARRQRLPPVVWERLLCDGDMDVVLVACRQAVVAEEVLDALVEDASEMKRKNLVINRNLSLKSLMSLASDSSPDIRNNFIVRNAVQSLPESVKYMLEASKKRAEVRLLAMRTRELIAQAENYELLASESYKKDFPDVEI